jgi:predicted deacetylase
VSQVAIPVAENTALLSIHDVSPLYEDEVIKLYDVLADLGINDYTLLLTPFLNMKASNRFEKYPFFSEFIESLGLEISIHGYSHLTKSGKPAEFHRMSLEQMKSRIKLSLSLLNRSFNSPIIGFIPPEWAAPGNLKQAAASVDLKYCSIGNKIIPTADREQYKTVHYLLSRGDGHLSLTDALIELEVGGPIQLSLHPRDWTVEKTIELLEDMNGRLNYRFMGYWTFLQNTEIA